MKVKPNIYTVHEVAAMLELGRNGVYAAVKRGEIPHLRVGRKILFPKPMIDTWLVSGFSSPPPCAAHSPDQ